MWYMFEVISHYNTDPSGGFITIWWGGNTSIVDFDLKVVEEGTRLDCSHCLPAKAMTRHLCALSLFVRKVMKPVVFALMTKEVRARTLEHYVADSNYVEILSEFGITREMLPTEMGGTVNFDQREWVAQRRAIELEEID